MDIVYYYLGVVRLKLIIQMDKYYLVWFFPLLWCVCVISVAILKGNCPLSIISP